MTEDLTAMAPRMKSKLLAGAAIALAVAGSAIAGGAAAAGSNDPTQPPAFPVTTPTMPGYAIVDPMAQLLNSFETALPTTMTPPPFPTTLQGASDSASTSFATGLGGPSGSPGSSSMFGGSSGGSKHGGAGQGPQSGGFGGSQGGGFGSSQGGYGPAPSTGSNGSGGSRSSSMSNSSNSAQATPPQIGVALTPGSQCVGALISSLCYGTVLPSAASLATGASAGTPTCHGGNVNGVCVGATF